jgi:hypothetical protein
VLPSLRLDTIADYRKNRVTGLCWPICAGAALSVSSNAHQSAK